jgi:hypothetical protein
MKKRKKKLVDNRCAECGHNEFAYLYETITQDCGNAKYDHATGKWEKLNVIEDSYLKDKLIYCMKCDQMHHYPEELE